MPSDSEILEVFRITPKKERVYVCKCVSVCVCVCEGERERERVCKCVCVCVYERESVRLKVCQLKSHEIFWYSVR